MKKIHLKLANYFLLLETSIKLNQFTHQLRRENKWIQLRNMSSAMLKQPAEKRK